MGQIALNMKKILLTLGILLLFSFASAEANYILDEEINLTVVCINEGYCSNSSYCNINIEDPNGILVTINQNMTYKDSYFEHLLNVTEIGRYKVTGVCVDAPFSNQIDFTFFVSYLGKEIPTGLDGRFIALFFFIALFGILIYFKRQINFEQWYNAILKKYKNRNFFRVIIGMLAYFFMDKSFSLFYTLGMFIILILHNIVEVYAISSIHYMIELLMAIYTVGILFVVMEILGDIQEFYEKVREDVSNIGWGLYKDE